MFAVLMVSAGFEVSVVPHLVMTLDVPGVRYCRFKDEALAAPDRLCLAQGRPVSDASAFPHIAPIVDASAAERAGILLKQIMLRSEP